MKKNKKTLTIIISVLSAIIVVLLLCLLFLRKKEIIFNIKETNINLKLGEKTKIEYSLNDDKAKIEWNSNNGSVIVDENGMITAVSYGEATIIGTVRDEDKTITSSCTVTPYTGEIGGVLEEVSFPIGYILMKPGIEMDLPYTLTPSNAYITSIDYEIADNNIVEVNNDKIISKNPGVTSLKIVFNHSISISRDVKVDENATRNDIVQEIDNITFEEDNIVMEAGDTKTLKYKVSPEDGYINSVEWTSSDESIVKVSNGEVEAINIGSADVSLTINGKKISTTIKVKSDNSNIKIDYNPKLVIKPNEKTEIKAHIEPSNINDTITYKSSNPSVAKVENGVITGVSQGKVTITATISNGKSKTYTINVLPSTGKIDGSSVFWGYKSLNSKTPTYADQSFFQQLAQNGTGTLQGSIYTVTSGGVSYSYKIESEILSVNNKNIKLRVYYPQGVDLSKSNTIVFLGGRGETDFYGAFKEAKNNPSIIKTGGIIALVAEGKNAAFSGEAGAYVTKFLKAITKQQSGVKNSIIGFSDGAHQVFHASKYDVYDRIVIFSGYVDFYELFENALNSEIIFMIGSNDGNYSQAKVALSKMIKYGFKNLTMVSMGNDLTRYQNNALIINPGRGMKNAHVTENVLNSGILEYLND